MFPIRDHNPSGRTPYVTFTLIAVNALVFLATWPGLADHQINRVFMDWGLIPARLMQGDGVATIVSSMFLHAGWMHILGNMLFLYIYGDNLEDEMGHGGFFLFYLLSGLAAAFAQVAMSPYSPIPMVGASGAIAGVMGGYLLLFPKAKVDVLFIFVIFFRIFAIPAWIVLGVWFALQIFSGISVPGEGGGVAYWAHVGGFAGGLILTLPALMRRGGKDYWRRTEGHPPHPEADYRFAKSSIPRVPRR